MTAAFDALGSMMMLDPEIASATSAPAETGRIQWLSTDDVFAPLPPMEWVVPGLMLGAGRPAMVAGYGFSGKTLAAQSLALAVASGRPVWGCPSFTCKPGRVRHFDYEQGARATRSRYQRLSIGYGIAVEQLEGRLELAVFPSLYLTGQDAEDAWALECEGVRLAIVDSLRLVIPGVNENDSVVGELLAMLARVSERTKTAFVVIHHAGKPKPEGEGGRDGRTVPRGSSAIFSACGTVLVLAASKGKPIGVTMEKSPAEAEGAAIEPYYLDVEDVAVGDKPKAGLRVSYRTFEQVDPPMKDGAALAGDEDRAFNMIATNQPVRGKGHLAELMKMRSGRVGVVLDGLMEAGRVVDQPERGKPRLWARTPAAQRGEHE